MTLAVRDRTRGLAKYDPDKGLKQVAVYEAAEKHYARAKDASKLQQAIRAKLEAQAAFVLWWDTHVEKQQGARGDRRPNERRSGSATPRLQAGKNGIPDRYVIDRWRQKLNDPDKLETAYEAAVSRYVKILELDQSAHVAHNSGENEWYTPPAYIEAARATMGGIDLDPASSQAANRTVKASRFFTAKGDGLQQAWSGRVWLNPPYAQPLVTQFAEMVSDAYDTGEITAACVLVNNATETAWFQRLLTSAAAVCFIRGRVRFLNDEGEAVGMPLQGQAVVYLGPHPQAFARDFSALGPILARVE